MNNISKEDIATALIAFTFIGAIIVFWGALMLYSIKKRKFKKNVRSK